MTKVLIFVYGSLMEGLKGHWMLEQEGVEKVGWGTIQGALVDLGAFPAAYPPEFCLECIGDIKGELYRVPENILRLLDRYEGADFHGGLYRRERVVVQASTHNAHWEDTVWVYFFNEGIATREGRVKDGDWRAHQVKARDSLTA
ncbi:hypothetical protein LCGC14_2214290 [marine sediment metagenome]|uniref:Gamma-glutamylcyclotransferase AIG2-like domain-containing protein n=1 Tax=marine sediment metagenome TaxID=412755 RepID=A0A0F9DD14_9ZZZZ